MSAASSISVSSEHSLALSHNRLCDEHAETSSNYCSPLAASHHSHPSSLNQQSSSGDIDQFDCNICMHVCHDPVVTMCGHLFCWPCLFSCLSLSSASKECPVCKADVQDKIVPLYGCGKVADSSEAHEKFCGVHIPCRPSAARWIAPANASQRREPDHAIPLVGFSASRGLGPRNGRGFLNCSAVSLLMRRRRFSNEKEFVLHWMFIVMACVAIAIFLAC